MRIVALAAVFMMCVGYVLGKETRTPTTQPSTNPATQPSTVLEPVKPATTQPSEAVNLKYREGTFIIDQVGRLTHDKSGDAKFVFESAGKTIELAIMANINLAKMEDAAASDSGIRFKITGMATEYRGKNYVLIDQAEIVSK